MNVMSIRRLSLITLFVALTLAAVISRHALAAPPAENQSTENTPTESAPSETAPAGWKLVWSDEFNGNALDPTKWDFDIGNGFYAGKQLVKGWGNDELEYYTKQPDNVFVADGLLHIRALKQPLEGCDYTSARLKSRKANGEPLFNQKYGRFEFRAKLPAGPGLWPALWLLPQDNKYGGWPSSGEIDVMEARGQEPGKVLGTLHYGARPPGNVHTGKDYVFPSGGTIDDFHVYALQWEPGEIRWFVDGKEYQRQSFWYSSKRSGGGNGAAAPEELELNPWPAPFDQPFFIIMNLAVGGRFLGPPDNATKFPAEMLVDYVRVYEKPAGYGPVNPRGEGKLPTSKPEE